jgi:ankyrin repeat protein
MYAVQHSHLSVISVSAEHNASVNYRCKNEEGLTALHDAVINEKKEILTELLDVGASAFSLSKRLYMTAVYYPASVNGNLDVLTLL